MFSHCCECSTFRRKGYGLWAMYWVRKGSVCVCVSANMRVRVHWKWNHPKWLCCYVCATRVFVFIREVCIMSTPFPFASLFQQLSRSWQRRENLKKCAQSCHWLCWVFHFSHPSYRPCHFSYLEGVLFFGSQKVDQQSFCERVCVCVCWFLVVSHKCIL